MGWYCPPRAGREPRSHLFSEMAFWSENSRRPLQAAFRFLALKRKSTEYSGVYIKPPNLCFSISSFFHVDHASGVLDAVTNEGLGIALLSRFDSSRHFFAWTPIMASSPIEVKTFFSKWGLAAIKSELLWIWLPFSLLVVLSTLIRTLAARH